MPISINAADPREPRARVAVSGTICIPGAAHFALWQWRLCTGTLAASLLKAR